MPKEKILIIEDEKNIVELLTFNLEQEGYRVTAAARGDEGLQKAKKEKPDLIILDLMLPEINGFEICKILKDDPQTVQIPIFMLTAKSTEADKVLGLELGADDYLTKPFSPREMLARVKTILRRAREQAPASEILHAGKLTLDLAKHEALLKDKKIDLTAKEFALLKTLMTSGGRALTREYLLENVWGYDQSVNIETRTVDMHIGGLRKKLGTESERLVTVKTVGYRFLIDD